MNFRRLFVVVSSLACLIAVAGEFGSMFICGAKYPGYSQMRDTLSHLGASASPVSAPQSTWWVIMGVLMILFGMGLRTAFPEGDRKAGLASWLIILYGLGEGLGSGLFKADRIAGGLSTSALIHDIVGGIGVAAILFLPLLMRKVVSRKAFPFFERMSWIILIGGFLTIGLFLFRYSSNASNVLSVNKGLWQRLFLLNTYTYFCTIAVIMLLKGKRTASGARPS
jgi:hypothetical protein